MAHFWHALRAPFELQALAGVSVEIVERVSVAPYVLRAPGDVFVEIVERVSVAPLARGRYGGPASLAAPGARET